MTIPNCPICKNVSTRYKFNNLPLYRCSQCTLVFQSPQPSIKELESYYKNPKYFSFWGKPENMENIHQMKRITAKILFSELQKYIFPKKNKLLEVGCATGALLETAKKNGFEITGIETNSNHAEIAKKHTGAKIITTFFENSVLPLNYFDVIVFFDVLEHVKNLDLVLRKTNSLLKSHGLLIISTPDTSSFSFKIMGKYWTHYKKEHLFYFNPNSLSQLLVKYGYKIELIKPSLKSLTLNYVKSYFNIFTIPVLSSFINVFMKILPSKLTSFPFIFLNGNMLVIARKETA